MLGDLGPNLGGCPEESIGLSGLGSPLTRASCHGVVSPRSRDSRSSLSFVGMVSKGSGSRTPYTSCAWIVRM